MCVTVCVYVCLPVCDDVHGHFSEDINNSLVMSPLPRKCFIFLSLVFQSSSVCVSV